MLTPERWISWALASAIEPGAAAGVTHARVVCASGERKEAATGGATARFPGPLRGPDGRGEVGAVEGEQDTSSGAVEAAL
jgi:hypothetical protein